MKRPAQRRDLAVKAVAMKDVSIALACRAFDVSETCYRYSPKLDDENEQVADLLLGLTKAKKTWGFGLCFVYLRNVQSHGWNHKRVYRFYRELELNLRIKPRKRLKREKPDELVVPEQPNEVCSMDFMADRLRDGRQFRLLNVLDDFNRERDRLLAARRAGCLGPEPDHRMAWRTKDDQGRHWSGIHQRHPYGMGRARGHRSGPYSARKTATERICRALQSDGPA